MRVVHHWNPGPIYRAIEEREDQLEPKLGHRERLERETELLMEKLYGNEEKNENIG